MLTNVDLSGVVRREIPVLIEKISGDPIFITGRYGHRTTFKLHVPNCRFTSNSIIENIMSTI